MDIIKPSEGLVTGSIPVVGTNDRYEARTCYGLFSSVSVILLPYGKRLLCKYSLIGGMDTLIASVILNLSFYRESL